jgi:hypothetical protein
VGHVSNVPRGPGKLETCPTTTRVAAGLRALHLPVEKEREVPETFPSGV